MRITRSDGSVIEDTAAELAEFEALNRFRTPEITQLKPQPSLEATKGPQLDETIDWQFASSDVAFRCLTRLKLSEQQKTTVRLIYDAGEQWVLASDIQKAIGYSASQFAGMMGAFGRRLINTRGYVLDSAFFDQDWDDEYSCYRYRLPPTVRMAVERARILD